MTVIHSPLAALNVKKICTSNLAWTSAMKLLISVLLISLTGCATYHYDAPTMSSEEIRQNYIRETGRIPCIVCDGSVDENGDNL